MTEPSHSTPPRTPTWRAAALWLGWWVVFAGWTVALLRPEPVEAGRRVLPGGLLFYAGKGLHVAAYASLAAWLAWLPAGRAARYALLGLLVLHAGATEYLQPYVGRGGDLKDVAIDLLGVALGLLLSARRRRPAPAPPPAPPGPPGTPGAGATATSGPPPRTG
jgi:VanZ family protein